MLAETMSKNDQLHEIARKYVLDGLGKLDFDSIPYADDVELRAPLSPAGSATPLRGREALKTHWWAPLPSLLAGADLLDTFVNAAGDAVTVEFHCHIRNPACTLRVVDRFVINAEGLIISQENFFDPRDVTNVGWRDEVPADA